MDQQDKRKVFKLDISTPIFSKATSELSVDEWFLKMENSMLLANILENYKVHIAMNYLKETAFNIAKKHLAQSSTWETLREELKSVFTPFDEKRRLKNQLIRLQQTDSFEKYLSKFHSLSYQLNLQEEDALYYFLNGLKTRTRNMLIREGQSKTLADAIKNAAYMCMSESDNIHANSAITCLTVTVARDLDIKPMTVETSGHSTCIKDLQELKEQIIT